MDESVGPTGSHRPKPNVINEFNKRKSFFQFFYAFIFARVQRKMRRISF